jgi:hypothetical protein
MDPIKKYPLDVSIYTSTMDPSWDGKKDGTKNIDFDLGLANGNLSQLNGY